MRGGGSIDVWKRSSAASFPKQVQVVRPKIDRRRIGARKAECNGKPLASAADAVAVNAETISGRAPRPLTHQHVRKTSLIRFPHGAPFRQGLSMIFWREISAGFGVKPRMTEIRCFPSSSKRHRHQSKNRNSLILRRANLNPFHFRPLMRTRTSFRYFGPSPSDGFASSPIAA